MFGSYLHNGRLKGSLSFLGNNIGYGLKHAYIQASFHVLYDLSSTV